MAAGSEQVSFKKYGLPLHPNCGGCGKPVLLTDPLMFVGYPPPTAVYCFNCFDLAATHKEATR